MSTPILPHEAFARMPTSELVTAIAERAILLALLQRDRLPDDGLEENAHRAALELDHRLPRRMP